MIVRQESTNASMLHTEQEKHNYCSLSQQSTSEIVEIGNKESI